MGNRATTAAAAETRTPRSATYPVHERSPMLERDVLSHLQKKQLRQSWALANGPRLVRQRGTFGERALLHALCRNADLAAVFGWPDLPTKQLARLDTFQQHAQAITQMMDEAVRRLDSLAETVRPRLLRAGERHARLLAAKRVQPRHWDALTEALVRCATEGQSVAGLVGAWRVLAFWIVNAMRDGYVAANVLGTTTMTRRLSDPRDDDDSRRFLPGPPPRRRRTTAKHRSVSSHAP